MEINTLEGVRLGGITQWIRICGADTSNPVLLLMQQGPGLPMPQNQGGMQQRNALLHYPEDPLAQSHAHDRCVDVVAAAGGVRGPTLLGSETPDIFLLVN